MTAPTPTLVKRVHLDDGAVLTKYSDGSWIIDAPVVGRHEIHAPVTAAADTLASIQAAES